MKLYETKLKEGKSPFSKRRTRTINTMEPNFTYRNSKGIRVKFENDSFI